MMGLARITHLFGHGGSSLRSASCLLTRLSAKQSEPLAFSTSRVSDPASGARRVDANGWAHSGTRTHMSRSSKRVSQPDDTDVTRANVIDVATLPNDIPYVVTERLDGQDLRSVTVAHDPLLKPESEEQSSVEILTEADLKPVANRWVLVAVGVLTVLSVAYLAVLYGKRAEPSESLRITSSEAVAPSRADPTEVLAPRDLSSTDFNAGQPAERVSATVPLSAAPNLAPKAQTTQRAAPTVARSSGNTTVEPRVQPVRIQKHAGGLAASNSEEPDVGF
jgi:hypothetical protein